MSLSIAVYDTDPAKVPQMARDAEDAGFGGFWMGEHVVLPMVYGSHHPSPGDDGPLLLDGRPVIDPETQLADPFVTLAAAAASTSSISVGTGILLLGLRHPLAAARAAVTLHELSRGRFILGGGVGWLREEYVALGVDFSSRGRRFLECLTVVRLACAGGPVSFEGEFYAFDSTQVTPRRAPIPIVLGGNSDRAIRRAVELADGWMSSGLPTLEESLALKRRIESAMDEAECDRPFTTYYRVGGYDPDDVARFNDAGMHNLVFQSNELFRGRQVSEAPEILGGLASRLPTTPIVTSPMDPK